MSKAQFPSFVDKHKEEALFNPSDILKYAEKQGGAPSFAPPEGVIFCYQSKLLSWALKNHANTRCEGNFRRLSLFTETKNKIGIFGGFGIGAPAATTALEELIAFGVRKFVSIGSAGSLQKDLHIGSLAVIDSALRDEGTSYHYLAPDKPANASARLTNALESQLKDQNIPYRKGKSWTTDAPYRETKAEIQHYQQQGILCVEMEASALFAVADYRNVEIASLITISDTLADLTWHPEFHSSKVSAGLESLFQVAVHCLQT
ncbi:MAG: nucleoside phosphorylase [Pseudobdellovibrionaceae bacterium]